MSNNNLYWTVTYLSLALGQTLPRNRFLARLFEDDRSLNILCAGSTAVSTRVEQSVTQVRWTGVTSYPSCENYASFVKKRSLYKCCETFYVMKYRIQVHQPTL
jgi:hypothetical protein